MGQWDTDKFIIKSIALLFAGCLLFASCRPGAAVSSATSAGTADFSSYLAIGDSYTAGSGDNTLTRSGQMNSYPERLFEQFAKIAGRGAAKGQFIQPLLTGDDGYPGPKDILVIAHAGCMPQDSFFMPVGMPGFVANPADAVFNSTTPQLNNIAVPGIRVADYGVAGYTNASFIGGPFSGRFYHDINTTPLDELKYRVANMRPSFITIWLGFNDVFGYAAGGGQRNGSGTAVPLYANYYNLADITPYSVFDTLYDQALTAALGSGAGGALINIPDIADIPFFNTIPANGLLISRQSQADSLTTLYSVAYKFHIGYNYFMIQAHDTTTSQARPGDLLLLTIPRDSIVCAGWGSYKPIPARFVLTADELQNINNATTAYNSFIKLEAARHNLAYIDMNKYMATLNTGIVYNGVKYNTQYITGGAFSLDGVHPTKRGYALIANEIISGINAKYGSTLTPVDANKYGGISFP